MRRLPEPPIGKSSTISLIQEVMDNEYTIQETQSTTKKLLDKSETQSYSPLILPPIGYLVMKKINKINPIAKELPKYGKRVVPDKRRNKEDKRMTKEVRDAKTTEDR
jgi:hypothetical protein